MYVVKITKPTESKAKAFDLTNVAFYNSYEHAVADIIDSSSTLYENLPDELKENVDFTHPYIVCVSEDQNGFGTDLQFILPGGIHATIAEPYIEDN